MSVLYVIRQETTIPKLALFLSVILLTGNLSALVDAMLHPEIPYFDAEHLIIGGAYVLLVNVLFLVAGIYYAMHKQEEDEIKRAKEEWERTFDAITEPIMILDVNHTIVKANKAMADKLGLTPWEVQGLTCYKSVHGLEAPHPTCPHSKLLADGQVHSTEIYEERLGGYFIITVSPIYDSEGRLTGSIHAGLDITERKKIEEENNNLNKELERKVKERTADLLCATEEIRESEELFKAIFDNAADGILLANPENKSFYLGNMAISQMLGYSWEEISKLGVMDIHPKESLSFVIQKFEKASNENINYTNEIPMKRKDGSIFYADISGIPITLKGKKYLLGIFRDITERRNAAEALQNALIASEASNRAKSEFLANMSHELTTPLNSVIGFSQILQDGFYGELNDNQKEYVNAILQGGTRLLSIIRNMLDLVRSESGKEELTINRFLLKDTLKSSVAIFNENLIKHNLKLTLEIEPDADIEIETDSGKLKRILYNLIDNAVKFTQDGGSVFVKTRKLSSSEFRVLSSESEKNSQLHGNFIKISVEDTGIGIKPENIEKLFQPFTQLESPHTKKYSGAGIGLVLAKRLVELLGGRIWAESEYGKGSRFVLVIPGEPTTPAPP